MIKTTKTELEILNLLDSNTKKCVIDPEKTVLKELFKSGTEIYNFSKNGVLFLFSSGGKQGLFSLLFQIIITNQGHQRLVEFKPKATKIVQFFGALFILGFTFPVILSFSSKDNFTIYFVFAIIYITLFALILWGLYWVLKTQQRQSLEKEIDKIIG
jgi:hypothetical protein